MKKILLAALLVMSVLTTFYACRKINNDSKNPTQSITNNDESLRKSKHTIGVNPYDFIGVLHNKGLNQFKQNLIKAKGKNHNNKIEAGKFSEEFISNEIFKTEGVYPNNHLKKEIHKVILIVNANYGDSTSEVISKINRSSLTNFQKTNLSEIFNLIENDLGNFPQKILVLEQNVLNAGNSNDEKAVVLCAISIAKYSYIFWSDNHTPNELMGGALRSDAEGAILSTLGGLSSGASETGLIFGPGGLVLTVAGSAVLGGITGSAAYFGFNIIWSLF